VKEMPKGVKEFSEKMAKEGYALLGPCRKYRENDRVLTEEEIKAYVVATQERFKASWDKITRLILTAGAARLYFEGPFAEIFGEITKDDLVVAYDLDFDDGTSLNDTPTVFIYCRVKRTDEVNKIVN